MRGCWWYFVITVNRTEQRPSNSIRSHCNLRAAKFNWGYWTAKVLSGSAEEKLFQINLKILKRRLLEIH
jgi:hypothetical protein